MLDNNLLLIASDHAGVELKAHIIDYFTKNNCNYKDLGANDLESVDYPDFANLLASKITKGYANYGILICGSGIGMSIAANRHKAIRAALCHDELTSELARKHNNANVLVLGARLLNLDTAIKCVKILLNTSYEGGRHDVRINKLSK